MSHRTPETASLWGERQLDSPSACNAGQNPSPRESALAAERDHLSEKLQEMRAEQQHLLERYVSLEEQNSTLTTLYVACQRLHSSLDQAEVLFTVREIIANLVGCEEYVLFRVDSDGWMRRMDSIGVEPRAFERLLPGNGLIGRTVETGEAYVVNESDRSAATKVDADLTACIPLKRNGAVTGAIALFRLLPQKLGLQELDRELFWLLESHLAMALHCAEMHQDLNSKPGARG